MKKILGICMLVPGILIFVWSGFAFLDYMTTTKEEVISRFEKTGTTRGIRVTASSYDVIDKQLMAARIVCAITTLVGAGVAYGGYKLFKRGDREAKLTERNIGKE